MDKNEIMEKIASKKDFSKLPEVDIEKAYGKFSKRQVGKEEKIRLTRELLHKTFGAFSSKKLLSLKDKSEDWILRKHVSTRERLGNYSEVYSKIFDSFTNETKKISVIDLGAGVNGFSYKFFNELGFYVDYTAIESVGQLVDLMNFYFEKNNFGAKAIHESLFNLGKINELILKTNKPKVVFLFKVLDSLEMIERDYSKVLLSKIVPLVERVVVSFATKSMSKRKNFKVKRNWIMNFIDENFNVVDDFEISGERYLIFEK